MKKETIEEAAERYSVNRHDTINRELVFSFIEGAKRQAEQAPTYTPKEVEFIKRAVEYYWQDWNQEHPDNQNDLKLTQQILSK